MSNDLMERYIYAVTKRMPRKQREDVSQELRGLLDDMLTDRCGGIPPTEKDIRVVLTELGSPQELYEKYDDNGKRCLIGQPCYSTYVFVLKIVLACVALGMTVSSIVLQLTQPQTWYGAAAQWLAMMCQGLLSAFAFVTLLFAFFYNKGIQIDKPFHLDDLPQVPKKRQEISPWESSDGIILSVVFLVVFLAAPQIFCVVVKESGNVVPIFNTAVIRSEWYIFILLAMVGITRETVKLMEKQYNQKVMVAVIAADILSAMLSFWWLADNDIVNPEFQANILGIFGEEAELVYSIFEKFNLYLLAIILLALVLDAVDAAVRTLSK